MSESTFAFWSLVLGQLVMLAFAAWTKWEQLRQAKVLEKTHDLSNSIYGASLLSTVVCSEQLVQARGTPADRAALQLAQQMLADHQRQQAVVDSKAGMPVA